MAASAGVHLVRTAEGLTPVGERVGLDGVLASLDRRARRTLAPGLAVRRALTWDAADRRDPHWWPQGITSSTEAGVLPGRRILVVSWYSKGGHGARVTFLDLDRRRYRHVLLVTPSLEPVHVHAGGLVWHGPHLYVAATGRGLQLCRLEDLARVPGGVHGHEYVLPVRSTYRARTAEGVERLRYSFCSLDPDGPALVVGEYGNARQTRRIARYPLDPATSLLVADDAGASYPVVVEDGAVVRTQGVVVAGGRHYLTRSHGPWMPGSVYAGAPGALRRHRWAAPMGPEDLTWTRPDDLLWSVSEHPRRRWIFAMRRRTFSA
ncbi:MAG TPA: hypothetical protein VMF51_11680 [Nocardioides sp.]|uniref:hypothetical protein n=1 Tax=Nocardioides sp. TaxID=35761 RepID=UPI002D126505|nr:hypothetical protein [Nocardioides sp.]HTW15784.1 hypothetical protein [Nocardioides sp.]